MPKASIQRRPSRNSLFQLARNDSWVCTIWKRAIVQAVHEQLTLLYNGNPSLQKPDETQDILEFFNDLHYRPSAWRLRMEGAAEDWLHPVLVLELLEISPSGRVEERKIIEYSNLWWRLDATEVMHLRVFRMDQTGHVSALVTDDTIYDLLSWEAGRGPLKLP